jgi:hypothetical protein
VRFLFLPPPPPPGFLLSYSLLSLSLKAPSKTLKKLTEKKYIKNRIRRVDLTEASMLVDGYRCGCSRDQPGIAGRELLANSATSASARAAAFSPDGGEGPAAATTGGAGPYSTARSNGDSGNPGKAKRSRGIGRGSFVAVATKAKGDKGGEAEEAAAPAAAATEDAAAAAATEGAEAAEGAAALFTESPFAALTEDVEDDFDSDGGAAAAAVVAGAEAASAAAPSSPSLAGA